jgi:hypothetical protein
MYPIIIFKNVTKEFTFTGGNGLDHITTIVRIEEELTTLTVGDKLKELEMTT